MELTREHFDRALSQLATFEEVKAISDAVDQIQDTLKAQSVALDTLITQTRDWNVEMTVLRNRMQRYESVLKVVGDKLHIDLETLLR